MKLRIKRVYEPKLEGDGRRILVDRLWPRGLTKAAAGIDLWLKDIAPSSELRKWFDHDPAKWDEFRRLYKLELDANTSAIATLKDAVKNTPATLLYGAKDQNHNQAIVIKEFFSEE